MNLYCFYSSPDKYVLFWYAYYEFIFLVLLLGYLISIIIIWLVLHLVFRIVLNKMLFFGQLLFGFALAYVIRNVQANRKEWKPNGLLLILVCAEEVNLFFANSEPELLAETFFYCISHTSAKIKNSRGSTCKQYMWSHTRGRLNPALLSLDISGSIWAW
jgi:hypothetical protein